MAPKYKKFTVGEAQARQEKYAHDCGFKSHSAMMRHLRVTGQISNVGTANAR